jgi:hypothetical protein
VIIPVGWPKLYARVENEIIRLNQDPNCDLCTWIFFLPTVNIYLTTSFKL